MTYYIISFHLWVRDHPEIISMMVFQLKVTSIGAWDEDIHRGVPIRCCNTILEQEKTKASINLYVAYFISRIELLAL